jgi:16S rRNA G966 N2-methylase RsmD
MRIIAGKYRSRIPTGHKELVLRPTTERFR